MQEGREVEEMPSTDLHCTLRYKNTPGPDERYDQQVHKLKNPTTICVQHLFVSHTGQSCCSVILRSEQQKLSHQHDPHISLTKDHRHEWKHMNAFVERAKRQDYGPPDESGWCMSRDMYIWKKTVGNYTPVSPQTHLDAPE